MEEYESQTERVEEDLHEHAHHAAGKGEKWVSGVALTAALLAALAAATSLLAGGHANEAMMDRIKASDQWGFYQAKKGRATELATLHKLLDKPFDEADKAKMEKEEQDMEGIKTGAEGAEKSSEAHFARHETLAKGVTLFQVAIAVSAISALTRRRRFWFAGIALGCVGLGFLVLGLLPAHPA